MKDIRVTVKVRNNRLLTAIEESGWDSIPKFCEFLNISYTGFLNILNMKETPIDKTGMIKDCVIKVCEELNKTPEELFSTDQMYNKLDMNKTDVEVSLEELKKYLVFNPNDGEIETSKMLDCVLEKALTPREIRVIRARYGFDGSEQTLREIGGSLGVHQERVRQIESKCLRKLKYAFSQDEGLSVG